MAFRTVFVRQRVALPHPTQYRKEAAPNFGVQLNICCLVVIDFLDRFNRAFVDAGFDKSLENCRMNNLVEGLFQVERSHPDTLAPLDTFLADTSQHMY